MASRYDYAAIIIVTSSSSCFQQSSSVTPAERFPERRSRLAGGVVGKAVCLTAFDVAPLAPNGYVNQLMQTG